LSRVKQQVKEKIKKLSPRQIIIILFFLACITIFLLILVEMVIEKENSLDILVFNKLRFITSPAVTKFMLFITFFGSFNFLLPAYIAVIIFDLYIKDKKLFLYIMLIGLTSTGLLYLIKFLVKRLRPSDPLLHAVNGFSFPSGHSFCSFTFFGLLIYIVWKDTKLKKPLKWVVTCILFLFAFTIALSRVYLHVHYASDVLAGFCLSVIWLIFSYWVIQTITKRQLSRITIPDLAKLETIISRDKE
jgi:membrane-associated phospholipid phosphatase